MSSKRYFRTGAVAKIFSVSTGTIWLWIKKGKMKAIKPFKNGKYNYMIPVEEVKRLCEKLEITFPYEKTEYKTRKIDDYKFIWLAGLVDGEGSLCLYKHRRKNGRKDTFEINFSISNTNKQLLDKVEEFFGGSLNGPYKYTSHTTPYWQLNFCPSKILEILPILIPYLIAKKNQAELILEAQQIISTYRGGVSREYCKRLFEIYKILKFHPNKRNQFKK